MIRNVSVCIVSEKIWPSDDALLLSRLAAVGRRQIFAITDVTQEESRALGTFLSRNESKSYYYIISDIL